MSAKQKKQKKRAKCLADFIEDVPEIIINERHGVSYRVLQFIGSGSYGKCYKVERNSTKENFACKVLSQIMVEDADLAYLVQNEIRIHRKLRQHPHIVEYVQSFHDDRFVYMVQSLCTNHSLRDLQKTRGTVSINECRYFISQILKGVHHIHSNNVIHRDLKLSNVLIDHNMQMKICDFGLAIRLDDPRLNSRSLCGTTNYLAPEVISRKGFVCRSDIWAVGVITYVLLFGYKPFEENDAYATHQRILKADYTISSEFDPEVKSLLRSIFQTEVEYRLSAEACLKLAFFTKHNIPNALPAHTLSQMSFTEMLKQTSCEYIEDVHFSINLSVEKSKEIVYQSIHVEMASKVIESHDNTKHALILNQTFKQFDTICRQHVQEDSNFSSISELDSFMPKYWVEKWSYDQNLSSGFVYELSDGSTGMFFHNGLRLMRTPDNISWALEMGDDRFFRIQNNFDEERLEYAFDKFYDMETMIRKGRYCKSQSEFDPREKIYLHYWIQTDQAMVMLLSNHTIQINFKQSHKKMIISPIERKITCVSNQMDKKNFKTVSFEALSKRGFSFQSFAMFMYVTSVIQHLALNLSRT